MLINSEKLFKRINGDKETMLENMPNYDYRKGFLGGIAFIEKDIHIEALQTELEKIKFDFEKLKECPKSLEENKVKLTTFQYEMLKRVYDNGFHWIAKDADNGICVYTNEPVRKGNYFSFKDLNDEYDCIPLWLESFNDIVTWEGGAVEISNLLNSCKVID